MTTQPGTIELVYDQPVKEEFTQVAVLSGDENACQTGEPVVDNNTVRQDIQDLPDGDYTVSFRVISADGHPVTGTFTFTMASESGDAVEACSGSGDTESNDAAAGDAEDGDAQDQTTDTSSDDSVSGAVVGGVVAAGILAIVGIFLAVRRRGGRPAGDADSDISDPEA